MMPTLQAKYILCKILVSDSVLRKDFFPQTVFVYFSWWLLVTSYLTFFPVQW